MNEYLYLAKTKLKDCNRFHFLCNAMEYVSDKKARLEEKKANSQRAIYLMAILLGFGLNSFFIVKSLIFSTSIYSLLHCLLYFLIPLNIASIIPILFFSFFVSYLFDIKFKKDRKELEEMKKNISLSIQNSPTVMQDLASLAHSDVTREYFNGMVDAMIKKENLYEHVDNFFKSYHDYWKENLQDLKREEFLRNAEFSHLKASHYQTQKNYL